MEKLDLVYILGEGSPWQDNEIRYSLRSVEKYFEGAGRIFIIGTCPNFINKEKVIHIPAEDPFNHKLKNAIWKLRIACLTRKVGNPFILMNDDFFFLRRNFHVENYHKGLLALASKRHSTHGGYYYKAIKNTIEILRDYGIKKPLNYDLHCPMVIEKDKFKKATDMVDFGVVGYLFRSFYGNYFRIGGKYRKDVKIYTWKERKELESMDFLSIDNSVSREAKFRHWMERKFPEKSRYEKTPQKSWYVTRLMNYDGKTYNPGDIVLGELPPAVIDANKLKKSWNFAD